MSVKAPAMNILKHLFLSYWFMMQYVEITNNLDHLLGSGKNIQVLKPHRKL